MRRSLLGLVLVLLLAPAGARADATFTLLGTLSGETDSTATAMSDTGTTVVGHVALRRAWVWTLATGVVELQHLPAHTGANLYRALGVSEDGSFIVGAGFDDPNDFSVGDSMLWSDPNAVPVTLGPSHATDVSSDGSVVSGYNLFLPDDGTAWRWTQASGAVTLTDPVPPPNDGCQCPVLANAISNDGAQLFGDWEGFAVSWTGTNPGVLLDLGGREFGTVHAVSADGAVPVGFLTPFGADRNEAVAWRDGFPQLVWPSASLTFAQALGVSAPGHVVVGEQEVFFQQARAFVWDAVSGPRDLTDLANAHGGALGTFVLESAVAVSADGLTFAGTGRLTPTGADQAWHLTLPPEAFPVTPVNALPGWAFVALGLLLGAAPLALKRAC